MTRARVAAPLPAHGEAVALDDESSTHVLRVMRMRPGEVLTLFDGEGFEVEATLEKGPSKDVALARVTGALREVRAPHHVHLLLAVLKGPAMDDAVRMATEAGMTHLHPLATTHAVPKGERPERWQRILVSACEQCRRADVPVVYPIVSLTEAFARLDGVPDRRVATPGGPRGVAAKGPVALLIGPEGGLSDAEQALAERAGFAPIGLGPFVLRGLTAAAVAVASVW